jgi:ubiquinone/menaquinone biosynthesis C-methylase UbiE
MQLMSADTVVTATASASQHNYVLGHRDDELARLDQQAATLAQATRTILTLGGVASGMRVLDIGTGTGEVAILAGDLVGPAGQVLGVDRSAGAVDRAAAKVAERGVGNVRFAVSDLAEALAGERFDAIIGRLVLAYQPSPLDAVRELVRDRLRPGGRIVAMEYDLPSMRSIPMTPLVHRLGELINAAFDAAGTPQTLGPRLHRLFADAGLQQPESLGIQIYLAPEDPVGPAMLSGVVGSLLPAIERHGLAAATDIGIDTLRERIADELLAHDAVIAPPVLVGAWGHI